jgi:hypothetical protein
MKKVILAVTVLGLAAVGMQTAKAGGFSIGVNIGLPVFYSAPVTYVAPPPQIVFAAPVYYSTPASCYSYCPPPPPRVVYAQPVYCAPAPVVVCRAPGYYAPAPVVNYRGGYGGEHRHYRHGRW